MTSPPAESMKSLAKRFISQRTFVLDERLASEENEKEFCIVLAIFCKGVAVADDQHVTLTVKHGKSERLAVVLGYVKNAFSQYSEFHSVRTNFVDIAKIKEQGFKSLMEKHKIPAASQPLARTREDSLAIVISVSSPSSPSSSGPAAAKKKANIEAAAPNTFPFYIKRRNLLLTTGRTPVDLKSRAKDVFTASHVAVPVAVKPYSDSDTELVKVLFDDDKFRERYQTSPKGISGEIAAEIAKATESNKGASVPRNTDKEIMMKIIHDRADKNWGLCGGACMRNFLRATFPFIDPQLWDDFVYVILARHVFEKSFDGAGELQTRNLRDRIRLENDNETIDDIIASYLEEESNRIVTRVLFGSTGVISTVKKKIESDSSIVDHVVKMFSHRLVLRDDAEDLFSHIQFEVDARFVDTVDRSMNSVMVSAMTNKHMERLHKHMEPLIKKIFDEALTRISASPVSAVSRSDIHSSGWTSIHWPLLERDLRHSPELSPIAFASQRDPHFVPFAPITGSINYYIRSSAASHSPSAVIAGSLLYHAVSRILQKEINGSYLCMEVPRITAYPAFLEGDRGFAIPAAEPGTFYAIMNLDSSRKAMLYVRNETKELRCGEFVIVDSKNHAEHRMSMPANGIFLMTACFRVSSYANREAVHETKAILSTKQYHPSRWYFEPPAPVAEQTALSVPFFKIAVCASMYKPKYRYRGAVCTAIALGYNVFARLYVSQEHGSVTEKGKNEILSYANWVEKDGKMQVGMFVIGKTPLTAQEEDDLKMRREMDELDVCDLFAGAAGQRPEVEVFDSQNHRVNMPRKMREMGNKKLVTRIPVAVVKVEHADIEAAYGFKVASARVVMHETTQIPEEGKEADVIMKE